MRPHKIVGLVQPWITYADELEQQLAEANRQAITAYDKGYADGQRFPDALAEALDGD